MEKPGTTGFPSTTVERSRMTRTVAAAIAAATLALAFNHSANAATYTYSVQALTKEAKSCASVAASAEWVAFNRCVGPAGRTKDDISVSTQWSCRATHRVTNRATGRVTYAYDIPMFWMRKQFGLIKNCN